MTNELKTDKDETAGYNRIAGEANQFYTRKGTGREHAETRKTASGNRPRDRRVGKKLLGIGG